MLIAFYYIFLQFVEKILEEGTKSPRTIRLAALHLTGLWLANPITIKFYMKELKLLTLYGSGTLRICLVFCDQCSDWKPSVTAATIRLLLSQHFGFSFSQVFTT